MFWYEPLLTLQNGCESTIQPGKGTVIHALLNSSEISLQQKERDRSMPLLQTLNPLVSSREYLLAGHHILQLKKTDFIL